MSPDDLDAQLRDAVETLIARIDRRLAALDVASLTDAETTEWLHVAEQLHRLLADDGKTAP